MEQVAPLTNSSSVNNALVVTLDSPIHPALQRILEQAGWQTASCFSLREFLALSEKSQWPLVVVSYNKDSASLIKVLQTLQPAISSERTFVVVIAEQPSTGDAILCMQNGAMEYLSWPIIPSQLLESADRARRLAFFAALNPQDKNNGYSQSNGGGFPKSLRIGRQLRGDARTLQTDIQDRAFTRLEGLHNRRNRHGQGGSRALDSRNQRAKRPFPRDQLRGDNRESARIRTLRS